MPVLAGALLLMAPVTLLATCGSAGDSPAHRHSVQAGYDFLAAMMDRDGTGTQPRLPRSYLGGTPQAQAFTASESYDNALMVDAFLARGGAADLARAGVLGESLRYVQLHDPAGDGRIRRGYAAGVLRTPADAVAVDPASDVGAMAWVGQCLLHLHARTGDGATLTAATGLAQWIQDHTADRRGTGGYTGGQDAHGTPLTWKSTEQNLDLVSFFGLLADATRQSVWRDRASDARTFVESMYDPGQRLFWTGTGTDGVTVNRDFVPEDTQTWSYLVLRDPRYAATVDTAVSRFAATDGPFHGVSAAGGGDAVWFEGTAHLASALLLRGHPGTHDRRAAGRYLDSIELAQTTAPGNDGTGIVASSRDTGPDSQGAYYYTWLHTGTTAWYLLARLGRNPFTAMPR